MYYVSQVRDGRARLLLGPFAEHAEALAQVDAARDFVLARDPWSAFDAFGTVRHASGEPGFLNQFPEFSGYVSPPAPSN